MITQLWWWWGWRTCYLFIVVMLEYERTQTPVTLFYIFHIVFFSVNTPRIWKTYDIIMPSVVFKPKSTNNLSIRTYTCFICLATSHISGKKSETDLHHFWLQIYFRGKIGLLDFILKLNWKVFFKQLCFIWFLDGIILPPSVTLFIAPFSHCVIIIINIIIRELSLWL